MINETSLLKYHCKKNLRYGNKWPNTELIAPENLKQKTKKTKNKTKKHPKQNKPHAPKFNSHFFYEKALNFSIIISTVLLQQCFEHF